MRSSFATTKATTIARSQSFLARRSWLSQLRCTERELAFVKRSEIIWRNIMKRNKHDLDAIIEMGTRAIRDEEIDTSAISESATRVWARVSQEAAENSVGNLNTM